MKTKEGDNSGPSRSYAPDLRTIMSLLLKQEGLDSARIIGPLAEEEPPDWVATTLRRLASPILKPLNDAKAEHEGDWWKRGFAVGVGERALAFNEHDVPTLLGDLNEKQLEALKLMFDPSDSRPALCKEFGIETSDPVNTEDLMARLAERNLASLQHHLAREESLARAAGPQSFEAFTEGRSTGYKGVIMSTGHFAKETQRRGIYEILMGHWLDIHKGCEEGRFKNRSEIFTFLESVNGVLPTHHEEWFNEICKDIGLSPKKIRADFLKRSE
jgi:hypothetical protein